MRTYENIQNSPSSEGRNDLDNIEETPIADYHMLMATFKHFMDDCHGYDVDNGGTDGRLYFARDMAYNSCVSMLRQVQYLQARVTSADREVADAQRNYENNPANPYLAERVDRTVTWAERVLSQLEACTGMLSIAQAKYLEVTGTSWRPPTWLSRAKASGDEPVRQPINTRASAYLAKRGVQVEQDGTITEEELQTNGVSTSDDDAYDMVEV